MAAMAMSFPNKILQNLKNIRLMKQTKGKRTEWVGVQYLPISFQHFCKGYQAKPNHASYSCN